MKKQQTTCATTTSPQQSRPTLEQISNLVRKVNKPKAKLQAKVISALLNENICDAIIQGKRKSGKTMSMVLAVTQNLMRDKTQKCVFLTDNKTDAERIHKLFSQIILQEKGKWVQRPRTKRTQKKRINGYEINCSDCGMGMMINDKNTFESECSKKRKYTAYNCRRCHACYVPVNPTKPKKPKQHQSKQSLRIKLPVLLIGGSSVRRSIRHLQQDPDIIVGTSGRIFDMINRGCLRPENIKLLCMHHADVLLNTTVEHRDQVYDVFKFMPEKISVWVSSVKHLPITKQFLRDPVLVDLNTNANKNNEKNEFTGTFCSRLYTHQISNPSSSLAVTIRVTHKGATSDSIPIELIQVGGDDMKHDSVTIPSITCGESLNVTFEIYLSKQQGTYTYASAWKFLHNDQKMSEERIWLHVRVVDETAVAKEMRECSKIQTAYIPSVNRT